MKGVDELQPDISASKQGCGWMILATLGLLLIFLGFGDFLQDVKSSKWQELPAKIIEVHLREQGPSVSGKVISFKGEVVDLKYEYEFEGRTYRGSQVALGRISGILANRWHKDKYRQLQSHAASGEPFRCFVNPDNPGDAVLYRELGRTSGSILVGMGAAAIAATYLQWRRASTSTLNV